MTRISQSLLFVLALTLADNALAASISGTYQANGVAAKLTHALAMAVEPFSGNPTTRLIFTEKDASADERPDITASFGGFGSALVVTLMKEGDTYSVIGCEFGHTALKRMGASGIGIVDAKDVKARAGQISGKLVSAPDAKIFDEPVSVDLSFDVPLR
ncbi:MAG: hypothetical protein WBP11_10345 [Dokdonella sp.]